LIFLDTDILSYFLAEDAAVSARLAACLDAGERICITSVNMYEVLKGFMYKGSPRKERLFSELLEHVEIFMFDDAAAVGAARVYADLRKIGAPIGVADILIAAIVMRNNGMLVSNNTRHYGLIKDLRLTNWLP
jgi:tRNA(fMet)-specific endonuclease VapC